MGCISTPMPNHLSTLKPHHNRVETTLNSTKKPHTTKCGKGSDVEQMRRMVRSVDELVGLRLKRDI